MMARNISQLFEIHSDSDNKGALAAMNVNHHKDTQVAAIGQQAARVLNLYIIAYYTIQYHIYITYMYLFIRMYIYIYIKDRYHIILYCTILYHCIYIYIYLYLYDSKLSFETFPLEGYSNKNEAEDADAWLLGPLASFRMTVI